MKNKRGCAQPLFYFERKEFLFLTNDQYKDLHKSLREFSGQGGLGAYIHYYYNNYEKYGINFRDEDPKKPSAEEANRAVYEKLQKYMHNANVNANTEAAKKLSEHYTNLLYPTHNQYLPHQGLFHNLRRLQEC